jgi:NADH-quinone oxidoreductase subunit F
VDESIAIRGLKRFMVEQETTFQLPEIQENAENRKRKVAIIGAGPAGLSCAYFLARLGYRPKVFEALSQPGGMLIQAIPAYRLPRDVLSQEIRIIERLGVNIQTGMRLGKDFTLEDLRDQGYEAVFLGVGAPGGVNLNIPGEDAEGFVQAIDFLRDYNTHGSTTIGKKIIVIGGGNSAVDAARTALRLGAESVTIVYRRTRAEMPAYVEEVEEAEREGIRIEFLAAPVEILTQNGCLTGVKCSRMNLGEFDHSGRRRPVQAEESEFFVEADQCIVAIGQSLNPNTINNGIQLHFNKWNYLKVNPVTGQTSEKWIFAGGDAVTGPASVVEAVAHGERAAVGIDQYLTGENHAFWRKEKELDTFFDPEADPEDTPRARIRMIPVEHRKHNFTEVELPWKEPVALRETSRCLRCEYREEC